MIKNEVLRMNRSFCPNCMNYNNPYPLEITETLVIRGESYSAKHTVECCDLCDKTYNSKRYPESLIPKCFDQYRAKHNYFFPINLINLENNLDISDVELSQKLGMDLSELELLKGGALPKPEQNKKFWTFIQSNNYFDLISV